MDLLDIDNTCDVIEDIKFIDKDLSSTGFFENIYIKMEDKESSPPLVVSQFSNVEKCLPKWRDIFPWVGWNPEDCSLYCRDCNKMLKACLPELIKKAIIKVITEAADVHDVGRILRKHNDTETHIKGSILKSSFIYSEFLTIYRNSYFENYYPLNILKFAKNKLNDKSFENNKLILVSKWLSKNFESSLIERIKNSAYFSVIADQCEGIIIMRILGRDNLAEEHVIWSYLSVYDRSPLQYINTFDIDITKMVIYIANRLCNNCQRCLNIKTTNASLPPRPPSLLSFGKFLWKFELLRPLEAVFETIIMLWKYYPHRFTKFFTTRDYKNFLIYKTSPSSVINILKKFNIIKNICNEIYQERTILEALGVTALRIQNEETLICVLTNLQTIFDSVKYLSYVIELPENEKLKLQTAFEDLKSSLTCEQFVIPKNIPCSVMKENPANEFLNFVEFFINEVQKNIYFNGKANVKAFYCVCNPDYFFLDKTKSLSSILTIKEAFTPFLSVISAQEIENMLRGFYLDIENIKQKPTSSFDIIKIFNKKAVLKEKYDVLYKMFLLISMMPFQPCQIARSLFLCKFNSRKLNNSFWTNMDLKDSALYIMQEEGILSYKEMLNKWSNLVSYDD